MTDKCSAPLGPLAVLVLGLLMEKPMHPYEMFQTTVERREDRLCKFRAGTMYHSVDRLAQGGLIEVHGVEREGNRPERTIYAITERGRAVLVESLELILARHPVEYPELYLALSEAHGLPRDRVVELLEERLGRMSGELGELDAARSAMLSLGKPEVFYLDLGCRIATLRAQVDWVDHLIRRLRSNQIEWLDGTGSPWAAQQFTLPADGESSTATESSTTTESSTDNSSTQKVANP